MAEDVKVPEGWRKVSLLEKLAFIKGKAPKRSYDFKEKNTIRYLTPEYLRGRNLETFYCDLNEAEIVNGDVVILWDGSNAGEIFFAKDGAIASTMAKIEIDKKLHKRFFYYYLKLYEPILKYQIKGSGIPHVEKDIFGLLPNIFPPLSEQCKISEILETLDNAIEKTERIIEKYKRIKQGLMQELLTKGIDENGQIRNEETHRFKDSPLDRIPEEWEVVRLEEILQKTNNAVKIGPFGSQLKKDEMVEEGYKVYGQENVFNKDFNLGNRFINKEKYKKLISCVLKPGDFVISMMGTIGKCAIVPDSLQEGVMDSHLIRLKINDQVFCKKLLVYLIEESIYIQKQIINLSVGGIMQGLNSAIVKSLLIPLPPLPEQKRIAFILSQVDETIEKEQEYKEKLEKIKRGLMEDLLTGKVRVNHLIKGAENV